MRNLIVLSLIVAVAFFAGCEKDDICDSLTSTTPRLVIEFYNEGSLTAVNNLALYSEFEELDSIPFNNVSRITVPLQTTSDVTKFAFVLNYNSTNPALIATDTLEFNYSRQDVFVSRACGYKTLFHLNDDDDPETPEAIILNNNAPTIPSNWIENIEIEKYNLENENEVHVKIYF